MADLFAALPEKRGGCITFGRSLFFPRMSAGGWHEIHSAKLPELFVAVTILTPVPARGDVMEGFSYEKTIHPYAAGF
jgi:hypothetical protein